MAGMGWPQLADAIVDRREKMGFHTREALLAHIEEQNLGRGLGRRVLADLETGRRENYDQSTLRKLETVLGWEQGLATRIVRSDATPPPADVGSLVGISTTSSQVIAFLDRDEMNVTAEEREKLRATIDLVIWPYVKTHLIRQQAIADVAREQAEARVERERREGAGG